MNQFSIKAGGVKSGRFRQKKVPIRSIREDVPKDSTKNENPTVDETSYADLSDELSDGETNDSQTLDECSLDDSLASRELPKSITWMFGGGFDDTMDKFGDRVISSMGGGFDDTLDKFGDSVISSVDGMVSDAIGGGLIDLLDDAKSYQSNAKYWKLQALKRCEEGKAAKPGDFSVGDSKDETEDTESYEEGSKEQDESDSNSILESSQEGSKEDDGLEILLSNDDESISSRQEKSGFRVKSKEFIKANEAEKRGRNKQRKWDRSLKAPIKDFIDANVAEPRAAEEEGAGTKQQSKLDRNLVAPIKTPQSMACPAPIFHSRSKFQGKDEDLNGPATVKLTHSGSPETSFRTVVGKPNVVDKSQTEIEVPRTTSAIADAAVASVPKKAEPSRFSENMFSPKEAGMEVSRISSRVIAIGDDSCLVKAESFARESAGNAGTFEGTASYEKNESDNNSTEYCQEDSKEDGGPEILFANDNEHISPRQTKSGFRVRSREFIKAKKAEKRGNEAEKRAKEIEQKWDRRKEIIEVSRVSSRVISIGDDSCLVKAESFGGESAGSFRARSKELHQKGDRRKAIIAAKEVEKRASKKIQRKCHRSLMAPIKDFFKAENSHDVPRRRMKALQHSGESGMELSSIPAGFFFGYTHDHRDRAKSPLSSPDKDSIEVLSVASTVSNSQDASSAVESETNGGRPRRVMSPMQSLEEEGVEVERAISPISYSGYTPDAGETDGHRNDQPPLVMGTIHVIEGQCSEVSKSRSDSTATGRGDADIISSHLSSLNASPRYVPRRAQKEIAAGAMHYLDEADMDTSSLPSPSRNSSRVKDTNGSTMTFQSVQKESPGKRVLMKLSGLDEADMDTSSRPSPSRKSSRVKDTNGSTMPSQSVQKESPGKRVPMKRFGLDEVDLDTSSRPSPSRKSSRVKGTNGSTMTSQSVQKASPGKRVPMKFSCGAHTIPFGDLAKASGTYAFEDGQRKSMIEKSSKKILQEDKHSIEPEKFKPDQEKQAFAKILQKMCDFNKTAPHAFSEVATIDVQSPMRNQFHQGIQNSPRSIMEVLSPSTPEQFNGEQDSSRSKSLAKQAVPINMAIQSKQESDNILQDLRHLTQTVSQTGISKAVPTRGPYRPDVPPPPSLPPTPARKDARPLAGFSEWEAETFDFSHVKVNAFASTKAQASVAPAIKPQTPKTNAFSSTEQIQAAAAPVSKPMAPTTNASSAPATKPLAAKTDAFPPAKTSAAPTSKPITPKANAFAPKQHPHAAVAPVSKPMALETNGFATKKQHQAPVVSGSQSRSTDEDAPPPSLQVSRQTFISKIQSQVSSTPVSKPIPRKTSAPNQHPQGPVAPVNQSFAPEEILLPSSIALRRRLQAPRQTPKVAQPLAESFLAPTVDAGGWEDFGNPFANDFKTAFANAHPQAKIATEQ